MWIGKRKAAEFVVAFLQSESLKDWETASLRTRVRFSYIRAFIRNSNKPGRSGSGLRTGTRNLAFVPISKWPKSRNYSRKTRRYYDENRDDWRSFRPQNFTRFVSWWDYNNEEWVPYYSNKIKGLPKKKRPRVRVRVGPRGVESVRRSPN